MYVVTPAKNKSVPQSQVIRKGGANRRPVAEPSRFEVKKSTDRKQAASFGERLQPEKSTLPGKLKGKLSAGKVILVTVLLGVAGLMYLAHVFTMQQIVRDLNRLQKEYERARLTYEDRMLTWERKTGPGEIYRKAKALGFEYGGLYDQTIVVKKD
jgi:hypothetical protein